MTGACRLSINTWPEVSVARVRLSLMLITATCIG